MQKAARSFAHPARSKTVCIVRSGDEPAHVLPLIYGGDMQRLGLLFFVAISTAGAPTVATAQAQTPEPVTKAWAAWVNCVADAAVDLAKGELPLKEAVDQTYRRCRAQENVVRTQLAKFSSDPAAEIERRKARVAPLVEKWVEQNRLDGAGRRH